MNNIARATRPVTRNYCREMAITHAYNIQKGQGVTNNNLLIGDFYMILFINYYADTYILEALSALKSCSLYKQEIKNLTNLAHAEINSICSKLKDSLGVHENWFADLNLCFNDAFDGKVERLKDSICSVISEHTDVEVKTKARLTIAAMFAEFASINIQDRINECKKENPIILNLRWADHDKVRALLTRLYEKLNVPKAVEKDLTIRAIWLDIQKKWLSPEFVAKQLKLTDDGEDETANDIGDIIADHRK